MEYALNRLPEQKFSSFSPEELASMQLAIHAVCEELGIAEDQAVRRSAVAERIFDAYRHGRRLPLDLVTHGLAEASLAEQRG